MTKVLIVVSDGQPADGDPLPLIEEIKSMGVTVVCLFLTSDEISEPNTLFDQEDPNWDIGAKTMFKMSSKVNNS